MDGGDVASTTIALDVRHPAKLVEALISHLGAGGHLSLEGDLSQLGESVRALGVTKKGLGLRRSTLFPRQDFVILPLDDKTIPLILEQVLPNVGLDSRVLHVQIAIEGRLIFGAYDNFHRDCVWVSEAAGVDLLEKLVAEGVLRSFKGDPHGMG